MVCVYMCVCVVSVGMRACRLGLFTPGITRIVSSVQRYIPKVRKTSVIADGLGWVVLF